MLNNMKSAESGSRRSTNRKGCAQNCIFGTAYYGLVLKWLIQPQLQKESQRKLPCGA